MTWIAAHGGTHLFDKAHWTLNGEERIGSAYWWFVLQRIEKPQEKCMTWPPYGSPARKRMAEFAIASAALLGAEFKPDGGYWYIVNNVMSLGRHEDQAEAACCFLSRAGYWVCFNKNSDEWELVRI